MPKNLFVFIVMVSIICIGGSAIAQVPQILNFQGQLNNSAGNPVADANYSIVFSIYTVATGGTAVWTQTQSVATKSGVFSVELTDVNLNFSATQFYLGLKVGTDAEMLPRQKIISAPSGNHATVSNGANNTASGTSSTIGGGAGNTASSSYATIGGGTGNTASVSMCPTVGGGFYNTASNIYATVGGGDINTASGTCATIGGGSSNTVSGRGATVPGGSKNSALGDYSFAAGRRAIGRADRAGTFIWADSTDVDFDPYGMSPLGYANSFNVRATGGAEFVTAINTTTGQYTAGVYVSSGGGAWSSMSDRNAKTNFADVNARTLLDLVAALPIQTWNYKTQDASIRHIGPMAQDFSAAFKVGENDTTISTVDADGVALAAIQGLYQVVQERDATIAALQAQLATQQAVLDLLQQRLAALEHATQTPVAALHPEE